MNADERMALQHVAANEVNFHTGAWGCAAGNRWRGPEDADAGALPLEEADVLDRLADLGVIRIEPRLGPLERNVVVASSDMAA
ncbi:hypothetical protein [Amycolatopsis antarctica]|uniref:hypothetical protein n=1 Tax=Amycolatopsis antarctica TaxID=1854586 RepID=UPI001055B93F|nr:hypothetical protein [Amycolatopsis antarctica]